MSKIQVPVESKIINSCNILEVTVGTNCPCGSDSGHGGRTFFKLKDLAGTDMRVRVAGVEYRNESVEIIFGGGSEFGTFMEAMEFAIETLKRQSGITHRFVGID